MLNVKKLLTKMLTLTSYNVKSLVTDGTVTISNATLHVMLGRIAILYMDGKANTTMSAGTLYTACTVGTNLCPLVAFPGGLSGNGSGAIISNGTFSVRPQANVASNANAYLVTSVYFLNKAWS